MAHVNLFLLSSLLLMTTPIIPQAPLPKEPNKKEITRPKLIIPKGDQEPQELPEKLFYYPGVVTLKGGAFVGGDNFVNIGQEISLQIDLITPDGVDTKELLASMQKAADEAFMKDGLTPSHGKEPSSPPLPFFSILVLVHPVKEGYAAMIAGRLFEKVSLDRVRLDQGDTFQAITWEQINLVVSAKEDFDSLVLKGEKSLLDNFLRRLSSQRERKP